MSRPPNRATSPPPSRWQRAALHVFAGSTESLAGTVYGTIIVLAVIAAGSAPKAVDASHLLALVVSTALVLWVGHVDAHGLAESMKLGRRLHLTDLRMLARREAALPLAALAPSVALSLGALTLISEDAAVWLALGLGIATLGFGELRYARLEHFGYGLTLLTISVNIMLGVSIVLVKIAVTY